LNRGRRFELMEKAVTESPVFLLVDIGNTCMVFGLYRGDTLM